MAAPGGDESTDTQTMCDNKTAQPCPSSSATMAAHDKPEALTTLDEAVNTNELESSAQQTRSSSPHTVFDIPELLEMILQELDPLDIVMASSINTMAKDLVTRSSALRKAMSVDAEPDSSCYIPLLGRCTAEYPRHDGFLLDFLVPSNDDEDDEDVEPKYIAYHDFMLGHETFRAPSSGQLPTVSGLGRNMMFIQPPVRLVEISLMCCSGGAQPCNDEEMNSQEINARNGSPPRMVFHPVR
ncbi:hypothetical protein LTR09_000805 [Extremus antarcticus]|uniref:F-box domain-containing protein n=1 Tax=Extremus antarcticus TaxID=702011 RepID=A0AAJ0GKB7_9PEZI|nr:hypothetical protein LTR09_000805 [Extremus antarcticus]